MVDHSSSLIVYTFRCPENLSLTLDYWSKKIGVPKHSLIIFALYDALVFDENDTYSFSEYQLSNS